MSKTSDRLDTLGRQLTSNGKNMTKRVTIPLVLVVLGLFTFPFGILFWIIAASMAASSKK
jgi:hypothetical protein